MSADTATAPRRLTRPRDERIVAGVCSGIARYYDIDPVIPRVVLAVLAVFGGAGLIVYAFAWLLVPEEGSPQTRLERRLEAHGGRGRDLMIVLLVLVALAVLLPARPLGLRFSGLAFVLVVVLVAAALASRRWRVPRVPAAAPPVYGPMPPPPAWEAPAAAWVSQPRVERARSWLPWAVFGVTLLTGGIMSAAAAAGAAHPQPADVLAACLAVVGIGLLVGAVSGRAWSMIPLGVVLAVLLAVAAVLPQNLTWTAGNRTWVPPPAASAATYVLGAGDAVLDLSRIDPHRNLSVTSRVGAGHVHVLVPPGETVQIRARAGAGEVLLFGHENNGIGQDVRRTVAGGSRAAGTLTLDVQVGYGKVEVDRAAT